MHAMKDAQFPIGPGGLDCEHILGHQKAVIFRNSAHV
jgi:hypothetical protein